MITITDKTQFDDVGENKIIHGDINNIEFEQSSITFNGSNNIIVIENGVKMKNCMLKINGENTLFYLSEKELDCPMRFDVAEVYQSGSGALERIEYIKNAF